jgi:hypothetical protein
MPQKRRTRPPFNVEIQKFRPSLQTPIGKAVASIARVTEPRGERSAAFQSDTLWPRRFRTRTLSPSNEAFQGPFSPFPVSVAMTAPLEARTMETELLE